MQDFVDIGEIDPIYFDSPYYLGPGEGAEKAYSLLAEAMEESGKVAIARFVFRNKEHLAAIRPTGGVLTLTTMRFADEVVSPDELTTCCPRTKPQGRQAGGRDGGAADRLADSRLRPRRLPRRVPRGAAGPDRAKGRRARRSSTPAAEEPKPTRAPDLMAALEESIAAVKERRERKAEARRRANRRAPKPSAAPNGLRAPRVETSSSPVASSRAGRGRRARAQAHQPRQGALPEGRLHQGRGHRLLRAGWPRRSCPT